MMKLKKTSLVILMFCLMLLVTGCSEDEKKNDTKNGTSSATKVTIVDKDFDREGSGSLSCTQGATASEGIDVDLSYVVTYENGNILILHSTSKITSNDQADLDLYENAYESIADSYKDLDHYNTSIVRDDNSVTYDTIIDYDNINIDQLLDIEGEEDNIILGDEAKLSLWLDLAEQVGVTCEEA